MIVVAMIPAVHSRTLFCSLKSLWYSGLLLHDGNGPRTDSERINLVCLQRVERDNRCQGGKANAQHVKLIIG